MRFTIITALLIFACGTTVLKAASLDGFKDTTAEKSAWRLQYANFAAEKADEWEKKLPSKQEITGAFSDFRNCLNSFKERSEADVNDSKTSDQWRSRYEVEVTNRSEELIAMIQIESHGMYGGMTMDDLAGDTSTAGALDMVYREINEFRNGLNEFIKKYLTPVK